jgi:hypothetical protein
MYIAVTKTKGFKESNAERSSDRGVIEIINRFTRICDLKEFLLTHRGAEVFEATPLTFDVEVNVKVKP